MKKKKQETKYGIWKVSRFMLLLAWQKRKSVIGFSAVLVLVQVLLNLAELFVAPTILAELEGGAQLKTLVPIIAFFTVSLILLNGFKGYFSEAERVGKIEIRMKVAALLNRKKATMSYPYVEDENVTKKNEKAVSTTYGNTSPAESIWENFVDLFVALILFITYIVMLTNISFVMIAVVVATCLLSYFSAKKINEWGYRHREEEEEYISKVKYASFRSEEVEYAKDIRIFGMKNWIDDMFYSAVSLLKNFITKGEKEYIKADFIDLTLAFLRNGIAYIYLINLVLVGNISVAEFLLYFTMVGAFSAMLTQFLSKMNALQKKCIELSAVPEYLETKELFKFEDGKSINPKASERYEIKLNNVSFKYPQAEAYTLKKINLTLKPSEKIAVVGLNGAGKTTLVKLICGFYDPTEGEVLLNGENIKEFNRRDYYTFFTAVFQEFSVLEATVAENVAQLKKGIDIKRVDDCIEKAGLTEKINSLPNRIETYIGRQVYEDGVELSGGETQRLMLARALYKNAPIIVLDEPTAALDPLAESDMYNKYNEMSKGRTSVYISHRLASTRFCDRIILIDNGIIAEEGTHEQLVDLGEKYAELYEVQSRYYREGENF